VNAGGYDAFVAKVKATPTQPNGLDYYGYIGGPGVDEGRGIAIDSSGNALPDGRTAAELAGFPVTTAGPDDTYNGAIDAFVAKVDAAGTTLVYCGYIGGSQGDEGHGIAVDGSGNAYVTGYTISAEDDPVPFPVTVGPGLTHKGVSTSDAFVAKLSAMPAACSGAASKPWYNANWSYRRAIFIDHTKVVADLLDFPVLVSLIADAGLAAHARPDRWDVLFTDEDGTTKLSHQIESYNGAGNLVAWVKVPSLPSGADKLLFMYFGNASALDQQSVNDTWSNG